MFTGIIQDIGTVTYFSRYQKTQNLRVRSQVLSPRANIGDSICVNGACLTVTKISGPVLSFDLLSETMSLTNLGFLKAGDSVNLEEGLAAGSKVSGHFVTGHIDCSGTIKEKGIRDKNIFLEITMPKHFIRFAVPKGSIAIDGISLTVVEVFSQSLTVYLIAHTLANTILGKKSISAKVNIELDILAKYAQNSR